MKLIEYIDGFLDEASDALKYAERYIDCKVSNTEHARNYYDMATDELKHAGYLREFAGEEVKKLRELCKEEDNCYLESWKCANSEYAEKVAKVKWILTL